MKLEIHLPERETLWRVVQFGQHRVPAGRPYWHENASRVPPGLVVVQATLEGAIVLRDARGDHPAPAGSLLVFQYGDDSAYGKPRPSETAYACRWVCLQGAGLPEHAIAFRQAHGPVIDARANPALLAEHERLIQMADPDQPVTPTDMAHAVHLFMIRLFEHADHRRHARLTPVQRAVEQLVRQPHVPWSIKQVADQHRVSREHLCRVFRQRTGQTPHEYLNRARLDRALHLITQTDLSLRDVARQAGYPAVHTLARQVRRAAGRSPTQLRANL